MERVGIGFDSHKYKKGNGLYLGGVFVECQYSFQSHSDGDIIIHSVIDAILGALPDVFQYQNIGTLFPDNDPKYENIKSTKLLENILSQIKPWKIDNCDIVLIMEKPKLKEEIFKIIENMKKILNTEIVNIKPKTAEGMGLIGKGKAAAAICVIKLSK